MTRGWLSVGGFSSETLQFEISPEESNGPPRSGDFNKRSNRIWDLSHQLRLKMRLIEILVEIGTLYFCNRKDGMCLFQLYSNILLSRKRILRNLVKTSCNLQRLQPWTWFRQWCYRANLMLSGRFFRESTLDKITHLEPPKDVERGRVLSSLKDFKGAFIIWCVDGLPRSVYPNEQIRACPWGVGIGIGRSFEPPSPSTHLSLLWYPVQGRWGDVDVQEP